MQAGEGEIAPKQCRLRPPLGNIFPGVTGEGDLFYPLGF